jgi:hypothetical protein
VIAKTAACLAGLAANRWGLAMATLEERVTELEDKLKKLKDVVNECCAPGPGPGRPCRSGRATIVPGYELASVEHALQLLGKLGLEKGAPRPVMVSGYEMRTPEVAKALLKQVGIQEKGLPPDE